MNHPALEVRNVSKRYGNREALRGVDLDARTGDVHGLVGPNGAGKTALMRVLLGLVRADDGAVRLLERDPHSIDRAIPNGVAGFVETPAFYPYLSGRKNLSLLARLDGMSKTDGHARADDLLEQVGLGSHADVQAGGYSAGMRQRLGLAAALLRRPQLLVLDEPTSSLDPGAARDVRTIVRRLAEEGTAVLLSSHDMAEVEDLCGMLTVIDRGKVVFAGTVEEMRQRAPGAIYTLHTSNNRAALSIAAHRPGIKVAAAREDGIDVSARLEALDAYVIALGCAGIAVRLLTRGPGSLESLFFEVTEGIDQAKSSASLPPAERPEDMAVLS